MRRDPLCDCSLRLYKDLTTGSRKLDLQSLAGTWSTAFNPSEPVRFMWTKLFSHQIREDESWSKSRFGVTMSFLFIFGIWSPKGWHTSTDTHILQLMYPPNLSKKQYLRRQQFCSLNYVTLPPTSWVWLFSCHFLSQNLIPPNEINCLLCIMQTYQ